jgi:hypothetical protein
MRNRFRAWRIGNQNNVGFRQKAGLVGHWVGESTGSMIKDLSGYNNDCAFANGPIWHIGHELRLNSVRYDGVDSYASTPATGTGTGNVLSIASNQLTMSCWVYSYGAHSDAQIFVCKPVSDSTHTSPFFAFTLHVLGTNGIFAPNQESIRIGVTTGGVFAAAAGPASGMIYNRWIHVAGTYDGANMVLYLNGNQIATAAKTGNVNEYNTGYRIGNNGGASEPMDGLIEDVRLYNRVLSGAEIQLLADPNNMVYIPASQRTPGAFNRRLSSFFISGF